MNHQYQRMERKTEATTFLKEIAIVHIFWHHVSISLSFQNGFHTHALQVKANVPGYRDEEREV